MRLIDADALIKYCEDNWIPLNVDAVNEQPTIEPERKKGKWKRKIVDSGYNADWVCSECGDRWKYDFINFNFCPNCGADMRGEENGKNK